MTTPRDVWLHAGQDLLRDGGVVAVKLQALTDRTGLTTGSFYHHFRSTAAFLDELAGFFGTDQVQAHLATLAGADPRDRLRGLIAIARRERMGALDAAMRDWAGSNPRAAAAVRAADAQLLQFVADAFEDLGHERADARLRAHLLQSWGVARVMPPWRVLAADAERVLAILAP